MTSPLDSPLDNFRTMLRLALPVLLEEFLNLSVGYTDWWLTGHYLPGVEYRAAMGLMAYSMWLIPAMFSAVAIGATAMSSRFVGAKQLDEARSVANQSLLIGAAFAAVVTSAALLFGESFVRAMQLEGAAAQHAIRYLTLIAPSIPFIMIEQVAVACLHGAGDTVSGCVAKVIVNVVNLAVSYSLVTGWGLGPKLGWDGLAIGACCGHTVGGLVLLAILLRGHAGLRVDRAVFAPDWSYVRRLLRVGIPGGIDILLLLTCHLVYVAIINHLGEAAAAAHGLGVQIEAMSYLPGTAFQVAASTIAGQALGAGKPGRATNGVLITAACSTLVMSTAACLFYFQGDNLAAFFTGDRLDSTTIQTARLLKIVAISTPFLSVLMVFNGAFRGAGDTRLPLLITFAGLLGVRIPGACWLAWSEVSIPGLGIVIPGCGLGVEGAWYAMTADVILRSLLVMTRFWQGGWRGVRV